MLPETLSDPRIDSVDVIKVLIRYQNKTCCNVSKWFVLNDFERKIYTYIRIPLPQEKSLLCVPLNELSAIM